MAGLPPYQGEVQDLFASEWSRKAQGHDLDVRRAAQILAFSASRAKDPPPRTFVWSSILAIHQYATSNPQAIDFLISVFAEMIKLLPDTVSNEYGNGPDAGLEALRWWINDEADCFNFVEPSNPAGDLEPNDKSNLVFKEDEINNRLDAVMSRIQDWRTEKTKIIISMAIASRCFALDIIRETGGEQIAGLINGNLQRDNRWTKADFIASCMLLRGCAKSLVEVLPNGKDLLDQWKLDFRPFLLPDERTGDNDFVVKYHAAVSYPHHCAKFIADSRSQLVVRNLGNGPTDESSRLLFSNEQWVF